MHIYIYVYICIYIYMYNIRSYIRIYLFIFMVIITLCGLRPGSTPPIQFLHVASGTEWPEKKNLTS